MADAINVLVVDDIEKNLVAMRALLERPGLKVLAAASGVEALEILLEQEVALALVDVNMPEMDGFELAELIRGNPKTRTIPLIFVTAAQGEPARTFRGYRAGAVDFIGKPFEPEILRSKVEVFVELYSQRKLLAQQLTMLRKALEINDMYNAMLGHDLRTPLAAVMTGAELIAQLSHEDGVVSTAKLIESSAQRMQKMVDQLLEMARVRSDAMRLELETADCHAVCRQIIDEFAAPQPQDITLEVEGDTVANLDRGRIARVLSNLIRNALEHGTSGMPVRVRIDGRDQAQLAIEVHNHGHISERQLPTIFHPYQSNQESAVGPKGLGLGLYIVKHLVEAHEGQVTVHSAPGQGTQFRVTLPRRGAR
jgi:signal transduction histidine kinase